MSEKIEFCHCGSGKKYNECCEPIIKGTIKAPTAESLMRARYTSYVVHEIDFIISSSLETLCDLTSLITTIKVIVNEIKSAVG